MKEKIAACKVRDDPEPSTRSKNPQPPKPSGTAHGENKYSGTTGRIKAKKGATVSLE